MASEKIELHNSSSNESLLKKITSLIGTLNLSKLKGLESNPKPKLKKDQSHSATFTSSLVYLAYHQRSDGEVGGLDVSIPFGKDGFRP